MNASNFRKSRLATAKKATINIRRLRLRTFIGFNPEEKEKMQDHLSTLLESLPLGVLGLDRLGRICSLNRRAAEIQQCLDLHHADMAWRDKETT